MKPIHPKLFAALVVGALAPAAPLRAQTDTAAANWHLVDAPGISAERAHRELLAGRPPRDTVVVAIIDSGVEVDHPDLAPVIWTNPREQAGNGRDDDGNGYVDDVHGWDFLGARDGPDVTYDTYEITRLYAACRAPCVTEAGGTPCAEIRPEFIRPADLRVAFYGDVAVVTGTDHLKGTYRGRSGEMTLRFTDVLVRRDGRWQLVLQQSTRVPTGPTPSSRTP